MHIRKKITKRRYGGEKPGRFVFGKPVLFTLGLGVTTPYSLGILVWNFYQTFFTVSTEFWLGFKPQIRPTGLVINFFFFTTRTERKFFPEILHKNLHWIWEKARQISGQTDEYSPSKISNNFTHKRTFLSALEVMNKKTYCLSCGTNLGFKYHPKLNKHSDERLVNISVQNTQGVRRSKSQTECEQTGFFKTKRPCFFSPYLIFVIFFMNVPPYLGANNIWKYMCEFFSAQYRPGIKLQKVGRNFTSFGRG